MIMQPFFQCDARRRPQFSAHYTNWSLKEVSSDVKQLPNELEESFDVILEKGLLDAVYLSGAGNVDEAVASLRGTLKPGGIFISVSGVVPSALRRELFADWKWLRDGENDLQAGCFILENHDENHSAMGVLLCCFLGATSPLPRHGFLDTRSYRLPYIARDQHEHV